MKRLLLLDAKNIMWRAASTMSELKARGVGQTGALYGFFNMVFNVMDFTSPDNAIVCWDDWKRGPAERMKLSKEYKARRTADKSPEHDETYKAVQRQLKLLVEFLSYLGTKQARSPGWEADDVMGTLAKDYANDGHHVIIFSGDKDMLQCVGKRVHVLRPTHDGKLETVDRKSFKKSYGFGVKDFVLYKALVGDSSDGYPGVPGIGDKTAKVLIDEFVTRSAAKHRPGHENAEGGAGGLEAMLRVAEDPRRWENQPFVKPRWGELLKAGAESGRLSHKLATINTEAPLKWVKRDQNFKAVKSLLKEWEMTTVLSRFNALKRLAWGGKLKLKG